MENNNNKGMKSPNLEVISSGSKDVNSERRHLARLCLTDELFRVTKLRKIFSVTDLTPRGMGLWLLDPSDIQNFAIGDLIEGHLNLRGNKLSLKARCRNLRKDRVGFEFEDLQDSDRSAIEKFLDPSVLGEELKPIPPSEMRDMNSLWYHGPSGTDLILRRGSDGQFNQMTLYVLGSYVQWDSEEGTKTGRVDHTNDRSEIRGIVRLESLILFPDAQPDPGKLSIAKKVILSSNLPKDLKTRWIRQLEL